MLIRRRATLAGIVGLTMAGCASKTPSQLNNYVTAIATGFQGISAQLQSANIGISPAILAQIDTAVASVVKNAQQIVMALTPQATLLQNFVEGVQAVAAIVSPFFPVAPAVAGIVNAALSLLGTILQLGGVSGAAPGATPLPAPTMSKEQAMEILAPAAGPLGFLNRL